MTSPLTSTPLVHLEDSALSVRSWTITDPVLITSARRASEAGAQLPNWLEAALRIGVAALDGSASSYHLHSLERNLDSLSDEVSQAVEAALQRLDQRVQAVVGDAGPLALASQHAVTRLAYGVQQLIAGPDAQVPTVIVKSVDDAIGRVVNDLRGSLASTTAALQHTVAQHRLVAAEHVRQALTEQPESLRQGLEDVRTRIAASEAATAERRRTVTLGRRYEQHVVEELTRLVSQTGGLGTVAATGAARGVDASRLGDAVIDLVDPHPRVAVEAKLRAGRWTRRLGPGSWRRSARPAKRWWPSAPPAPTWHPSRVNASSSSVPAT